MSENKKQTILLLHGLRGNRDGLKKISEELSDDFEVVSPNLPGTGDNPELEKQDLEGHVEWLRKYVESLGVKPVMVGHSMGAIIGSYYVEKYPETVDERVILMSPILRKANAKMMSRASYAILNGVLRSLKKERQKKVLASRQVSWMISSYLTGDKAKRRENVLAHYENGVQFSSGQSLRGDLKVAMLHEVKVPRDRQALVVFGKKDKLSNAKLVREWAKQAGVAYCELDKAGHLINYERPEEAAKQIKRFLR